MRFRIESSAHLRLTRLTPAFRMAVTATRGTALMRRDGFERLLAPGVACIVEPFQSFELLIAGSVPQPAGCRITMASTGESFVGQALYRDLSRRIFLQPGQPWCADFAAQLLETSPASIRRSLFAEGAALGDLCRTQRLMRLLFDAPDTRAGLASLKRSVGWPATHDLEASFHDRFGTTLDLFQAVTYADGNMGGEIGGETSDATVPGSATKSINRRTRTGMCVRWG